MNPSHQAWADLLAAHLSRPDHVGSVVVCTATPCLWPLAEWRAPVVWVHAATLPAQDFHAAAPGQPPRHPAWRERLHPQRDAARVAEHRARADLWVQWMDTTAPAPLPATRALVIGLPHAPAWAAFDAGWPMLPLPGLRAHASPDVARALAAAGLPLGAGARWGADEALRLGAPLDGNRLVLAADGAQALLCTEPGHAHHVVQQGHGVVSASGQASFWLPYEGEAGMTITLAPLARPTGAVLRCGAAEPAATWAAEGEGQVLTVPALPAATPPLLHLALPRAALPHGRFVAVPQVRWTLELAC